MDGRPDFLQRRPYKNCCNNQDQGLGQFILYNKIQKQWQHCQRFPPQRRQRFSEIKYAQRKQCQLGSMIEKQPYTHT